MDYNNISSDEKANTIAALYDIHANPVALQAVLEDMENHPIDLIVVGGDVVAGPLPNETITLLESVKQPILYIRGNAESEVLRYLDGQKIKGLSDRAEQEAQWVADQLRDEYKQAIRNWGKTITIDVPELGQVLFCHATPYSDVDVFTKNTPTDKLLQVFNNTDSQMVVCGHTHMQFLRQIGNTHVVNAGSVGMAFGRTGADWLLINSSPTFKHTPYDLQEAANHIRKSNYPHAESFVTHNVLTSPTEDKALQMLTQIELRQGWY